MSASNIPIVNFEALNINQPTVDNSQIKRLGREIVDAFRTIGFVYLTNHGVSSELLEKGNLISERFFNLPTNVKEIYLWKGVEEYGWASMDKEILNPERPEDLKETFNVTKRGPKVWPTELPEFQSVSEEITAQCESLSSRVLQTIAMGLELQDQHFFDDCHSPKHKSFSALRYLFYPPLTDNIKPGQIRCGEHSDYGSITLLFQDDMGGLQVYTRDKKWVDATPVPGAVLINIGDLMQRWTADQLVSTQHRVLIPEIETRKQQPRRSLAYFVNPDDDVIISCIDGSQKYEPITTAKYIEGRLMATCTY